MQRRPQGAHGLTLTRARARARARTLTLALAPTLTLTRTLAKYHEGCDMVLASPYQDLITGNDLIALIYGTDYTRATRHDVVDQIGRFPTPTPAWP